MNKFTIGSMSLVGKKKTGKTTLLLSAPKPMVVFDFEFGVDRVEPRFIKQGQDIEVHRMTPASPVKMKNEHQKAVDFWNDFYARYNKALEDPKVVTIGMDTFSAVWEIRRLAFLGELNLLVSTRGGDARKNMRPEEYFIPNTDMKQLLVQAKVHGKILIVTHHTRSVYEDFTDSRGTKQSRATGEEEPDGFKYTGDNVDVEVWMSKKDNKPVAELRTCGLSMSAEGTRIEDPTFKKLDDIIAGYRNIGS